MHRPVHTMPKIPDNFRAARALRRHHRERLKATRRFYWGRGRGAGSASDKTLGMALSTAAPCSCPLCGNPRRHFGEMTLQELRADEALRRDFES